VASANLVRVAVVDSLEEQPRMPEAVQLVDSTVTVVVGTLLVDPTWTDQTCSLLIQYRMLPVQSNLVIRQRNTAAWVAAAWVAAALVAVALSSLLLVTMHKP
jgi:hypothetical protein